ncbi:hypothetical protein ACFQ0K_08715 [Nocardioides caeni]|uniref:PRC-barrel domain containing protein n=1 Tax=Nocardioides caeni TaxID=574700 RepID=A0A4S8N3C2_9ACTN|nr:hypothetical protein [Nocardioides caeni]THV10478.1 hypothetical protein E9934_14210 [Nocardioides caeni]
MTARGGYDAALHLLDRQIVDADGLLVGKVDDVELTEDPDGALVPTGLLIGLAALLPRVSPWLHHRWVRMAPQEARRTTPSAIDIDVVDEIASEIRLGVARDGLVRARADGPHEPVRRTLRDLLEMDVLLPDRTLRVLDVRLSHRGADDRPRVAALLVGHGRPGTYLGYERSPERGPWLVATVIRWWHRGSRFVELGPGVELDWERRCVRVASDVPLADPWEADR